MWVLKVQKKKAKKKKKKKNYKVQNFNFVKKGKNQLIIETLLSHQKWLKCSFDQFDTLWYLININILINI